MVASSTVAERATGAGRGGKAVDGLPLPGDEEALAAAEAFNERGSKEAAVEVTTSAEAATAAAA